MVQITNRLDEIHEMESRRNAVTKRLKDEIIESDYNRQQLASSFDISEKERMQMTERLEATNKRNEELTTRQEITEEEKKELTNRLTSSDDKRQQLTSKQLQEMTKLKLKESWRQLLKIFIALESEGNQTSDKLSTTENLQHFCDDVKRLKRKEDETQKTHFRKLEYPPTLSIEITDEDCSRKSLLLHLGVQAYLAEFFQRRYEHSYLFLQHLRETDKVYVRYINLPTECEGGIIFVESRTKIKRILSKTKRMQMTEILEAINKRNEELTIRQEITEEEKKELTNRLTSSDDERQQLTSKQLQEMTKEKLKEFWRQRLRIFTALGSEVNQTSDKLSTTENLQQFCDDVKRLKRKEVETQKPRRKYFPKRRSYNLEIRLPTDNKYDQRWKGLSYRTGRLSKEPLSDLTNKDGDDNFIQNGDCPLPRRRRKQFHPTGSTTLLLLMKEWTLLLFAILLAVFPNISCASNTVRCPTRQYIRLKGRAVIKCESLGEFPSIYWYNNTNDDASTLIQKVNGEVAGIGSTTDEFNIDNEGSLVINNVKIQDDRTFRVTVLDSTLVASSYDITLIVYVEPAEPLPVIPECSGHSTCIIKGDSYRGISCIHGESRPAMEVSWFLRVGRQDRLLNVAVNQTVSADSLTFTTSAQLAVEKIPIDAYMNQLLVLVCKSSLPLPDMKGSERIILLDVTVDVPFTNEEHRDPVYAFKGQEDFMIKCQFEIGTENNVVLWMYKSLNSKNFEYIVYSAYGEVAFTHDANARFNLTNDRVLVIKQVNVQDEGYYACVSSSASTTESFVQNLEVIVLPNPPGIVVKGCEPFQPCHPSAEEAGTITCTVNGVRPPVDLSIVTYSKNVAVTKTTVNSHKEDGLFYTKIEGRVDVSKITCKQNVTVICQARGPAAYGFMSNAFVTVPLDGKDCTELSTAVVLTEDDGCNSHCPVLVVVVFVVIAVCLLPLAVALIAMKVRNTSKLWV